MTNQFKIIFTTDPMPLMINNDAVSAEDLKIKENGTYDYGT